jgi:hypothetical protein
MIGVRAWEGARVAPGLPAHAAEQIPTVAISAPSNRALRDRPTDAFLGCLAPICFGDDGGENVQYLEGRHPANAATR